MVSSHNNKLLHTHRECLCMRLDIYIPGIYNILSSFLSSFEVMQECWDYVPGNRPTFTELHTKMVSYIESMAGYLDLNFSSNANPLLTATTESDSTATTITNRSALLSVGDEPHSGDEQFSTGSESD